MYIVRKMYITAFFLSLVEEEKEDRSKPANLLFSAVGHGEQREVEREKEEIKHGGAPSDNGVTAVNPMV